MSQDGSLPHLGPHISTWYFTSPLPPISLHLCCDGSGSDPATRSLTLSREIGGSQLISGLSPNVYSSPGIILSVHLSHSYLLAF